MPSTPLNLAKAAGSKPPAPLPSPRQLSVLAGGSPKRLRNTRDVVAQVARHAVVETLRTEVSASRRDAVVATTELAEVREACRAENQRYEQEKQRFSSRLRSQKVRLDEVVHLEHQSRQLLMAEKEEKQRLELQILGSDRGARAQLEKLQQRCRQAEDAQADLQQSCAREFSAVEAVEASSAQRQLALELQEREFLQLRSSCSSVETAKCEAADMSASLATAEETCDKLQTQMRLATEQAEEETQRCAELRFELMHAVHHELPSERNRVNELEARERAEAERIHGVCEAEVGDLPPNLIEKVQTAIQRHELWWNQWSSGGSESSSKKDSGYSNNRNGTLPEAGNELISATTRYEAVLGALAQCAGASARENMELKSRLAGTWTGKTDEAKEKELPHVEKQLASLKREVAKIREENSELKIQRTSQEETVARLKKDVQSCEGLKDVQLMQKAEAKHPRVKTPGADVLFQTEHRRKMRIFEAQVQTAEHQVELSRQEMQEQESKHADLVSSLQQEVSELRQQRRESTAVERSADRSDELQRRVLQLQEELLVHEKAANRSDELQRRVLQLQEELRAREAEMNRLANMPPPPQLPPHAPSSVAAPSQDPAVQQRLAAIHRRLADFARAPDAAEVELLRALPELCERLRQEVAVERRERLALVEQCRSRDLASRQVQSRCAELETVVRTRDEQVRDLQRQLRDVEARLESLRDSFHPVISSAEERADEQRSQRPEEASESTGARERRKRGSGGRSQFEQRRRVSAPEPRALIGGAGSMQDGNGPEPHLVATLLQRWVNNAIDRSDSIEGSRSGSSSLARSSSAPPTTDRQPVKMLLSRWVKKAVESQDDDSSPEHAASTSQSPATEPAIDSRVASPSQVGVCAKHERLSPAQHTEPVAEEDGRPLTPRSPSRSWLNRLGIDFGSPAAVNNGTEGATGSPAAATVGAEICSDTPTSVNSGVTSSPPSRPRPADAEPDASGSSFTLEESRLTASPQSARPTAPCNSPVPAVNTATTLSDEFHSREWRGLDVSDTNRLMQWLDDVDQALPSLPSAPQLMSVAPTTGPARARLPSVAEEPSANSPPGPGPEEEADLEEAFQQAEALCDAQQYEEALPIFHELLSVLQFARSASMRSLEAEVRAHLGVTLQSLGRVDDAIEAYSTAVQRDPSLHVCHANLAQLYSYLEDPVRARMHVNAALRLDPDNSMYIQLDEQFRASESSATLRM